MRTAVLCIAAAIATCACAPQESIEKLVARLDASTRGNVAPIPTTAPGAPVLYSAVGGRDPFSASQPVVVQDPRARHGTPLEAYVLDSLRMVGTLDQGGTLFALVRSPDGIVHRVRAGEGIGLDYGAVTAVSEVAIEVSEPIIDAGVRTTRDLRLPLGAA